MLSDAWSFLSPVISGLIGAGVVYYFGVRQLVVQRRLAFVERQLSEFYGPLAGLRKQIRAKSELREKVSAAAQKTTCRNLCDSYWAATMHDHEERFAPFERIIEYDNKQLTEDLLPKYREMLTLFTNRYHLASADTRTFYQPFLEFVEIWNRWLAEALPAEVVKELGHGEEGLHSFYEHLEIKINALQKEVAVGDG